MTYVKCSYLQLRWELEHESKEYNRCSSSSCKGMNHICLFEVLLEPHSNIKKAFEIRLWPAKAKKTKFSFGSENKQTCWNSRPPTMHINWSRTCQLHDCPPETAAPWPQFLSPSMHEHTACIKRNNIYKQLKWSASNSYIIQNSVIYVSA